MHGISIRVLLCGLLLLIAGCAKPPLDDIRAKKQQVRRVIQETSALQYAPQAARAVQDSLAAIDALVAEQERKFPLFRKYDGIPPRLANIDPALAAMRREVDLNRNTVNTDVLAQIDRVRKKADEIEAEYWSAPAGKGGRTALGLILTGLEDVRKTIGEAEASAKALDVAKALQECKAAEKSANALQDELRAAKAKVRALRAQTPDF